MPASAWKPTRHLIPPSTSAQARPRRVRVSNRSLFDSLTYKTMLAASFPFSLTQSTFSRQFFFAVCPVVHNHQSICPPSPPSPVASAFSIPSSLTMTTTMLCTQEDLIDKHDKLRNAIENLSSKYQKDVGGLTYICAQEAKKCGFEVSLPRLISHIKRSSTRQQRFRHDSKGFDGMLQLRGVECHARHKKMCMFVLVIAFRDAPRGISLGSRYHVCSFLSGIGGANRRPPPIRDVGAQTLAHHRRQDHPHQDRRQQPPRPSHRTVCQNLRGHGKSRSAVCRVLPISKHARKPTMGICVRVRVNPDDCGTNSTSFAPPLSRTKLWYCC